MALDDCTVSQMITFKNTQYILASCTNGTLLVLSGPQSNSIQLYKRLKLDTDLDIINMILTSRTTDNALDLALGTEQGLQFATLIYSHLGRSN